MPPKRINVTHPTGPPVSTIGVRRPGYVASCWLVIVLADRISVILLSFGKAGRAIRVRTNHFAADIPQGVISHYDGAPVHHPS
jgi:hypothetical protein